MNSFGIKLTGYYYYYMFAAAARKAVFPHCIAQLLLSYLPVVFE